MRNTSEPIVNDHQRADHSVLKPGENCWKIAHVRRAAVLIDGASYFERLEQALERAVRQVIIVGWDFDWRIRLRPDRPPTKDDRLGPFLCSLAKARLDLEISILIWSVAVMHGSSAPKALLFEDPWLEPDNIRLKLDTRHPIYGAHHQKLVVIDNAVAFTGGIDLTAERWDRQGHPANEPSRVDPDHEPYGPVHDLQMIVEGSGAAILGDLARWRWRRATGEALANADRHDDPWPATLKPDFEGVDIAVSRTAPAWGGEEPIRESATLLRDAISAARRWLYIENQYLANFEIGDLMAESLARPDGPEIVILVTRMSRGVLERFAMGSNRDRLIRRMMRADRHDRLRVYFPMADRNGDQEVLIHTKLFMVDDALLRLGSSNLNNRSQGLDTECDVAIEARDAVTSRAFASLRAQLLGEHLDIDPTEFAETLARHGSLIKTIETLNSQGLLRRFDIDVARGPVRPLLGTGLMDPKKPFEPIWWLRRKLGL
jgi:phosphatidylserine/phosphatidylglycerophosphate/cardiolipin synthase-like enzyme